MKILTSKNTNQLDFINFWSNQYKYSNEHLYNENIGKDLTKDRILKLFEWKNGTPLSTKKFKSVMENYVNDTTVFPLFLTKIL